MKKYLNFLFLIYFLFSQILNAQNKNSVWVFGDGAGIDFTTSSSPYPISSHVISRGSCTNICNSAGQLLFYYSPDTDLFSTGYIRNGEIFRPDGTTMLHGDSLVGLGWYYEMIIVPFPNDTNKFYVFCVGVTSSSGLWYHVVDMTQDNGKGAVIQRNIHLLNHHPMIDGLSAIKHGNGRDWWVICRRFTQSTYNNDWFSFLITPSGISNVMVQNVGTLFSTNNAVFTFNKTGDKICFINAVSLIELYDFDRCTGVISNPINIEPEVTSLPYPFYWSCAFSPNGRYLYVSSQMNPKSRLWQFDTWASNIDSTKTKLWQVSYPPYTIGALKLAPDNKIYLSCAWVDSSGNSTFPYDSTMYYPENMNLGVINSPDSQGLACNFHPWSFYLGGKRTYWGLPNNPDYDLGPVIGSSCDSLSLCNPPTVGLKAVNITSTSAQLKWSKYPIAIGYKIRYRQPGLSWMYKTVTQNIGSKVITNLVPGKKYRWAIATICSAGDTSAYSVIKTFTTVVIRQAVYNAEPAQPITELTVHPNPAKDLVYVHFNSGNEEATIKLIDLTGKTLITKNIDATDDEFNCNINVSSLSSGLYCLIIYSGDEVITKKIIKE